MATRHERPPDQALLLRGATLVDGTGAPARPGEVLVRAGRIEAVGAPGELSAEGAEVLDLTGLVLSPGFIDIHTHYDAQVLWDPDLTPSSWHGVTTVVMGNCGFSLAPTRAVDRPVVVGTLENVEDMSADALDAGIRWEFETFPEYLDLLDRLPKRLNVASMVGHSAVRLFAMGPEAMDRAATSEEVAVMQQVVGEALDAGAVGFATSRSASHVGHGGRPVASRVGDTAELLDLVDAVTRAGHGVVQIAAGAGLDEVAGILARTDRNVTWSALLTGRYAPRTALEMVDATEALGGRAWPQISCRPLVLQTTLLDPRALGGLAPFTEVLALPVEARGELYRSAAWRVRAAADLDVRWKGRWENIAVDESDAHPELCGRSAAELGAQRRVSPFDAMVEVALDDELRTRFSISMLNDDDVELGALLRDDRTLLGLSDAGADASQLCDACYSTHLLGRWVREQRALSLEKAVWRLTGQPAEVFGIPDRGVLRPGYVADLVAFDPATVAPGARSRVRDLPAGAERIVVQAVGVEHVLVGGEPVVRHGAVVEGATPGRLLRGAGAAR